MLNEEVQPRKRFDEMSKEEVAILLQARKQELQEEADAKMAKEMEEAEKKKVEDEKQRAEIKKKQEAEQAEKKEKEKNKKIRAQPLCTAKSGWNTDKMELEAKSIDKNPFEARGEIVKQLDNEAIESKLHQLFTDWVSSTASHPDASDLTKIPFELKYGTRQRKINNKIEKSAKFYYIQATRDIDIGELCLFPANNKLRNGKYENVTGFQRPMKRFLSTGEDMLWFDSRHRHNLTKDMKQFDPCVYILATSNTEQANMVVSNIEVNLKLDVTQNDDFVPITNCRVAVPNEKSLTMPIFYFKNFKKISKGGVLMFHDDKQFQDDVMAPYGNVPEQVLGKAAFTPIDVEIEPADVANVLENQSHGLFGNDEDEKETPADNVEAEKEAAAKATVKAFVEKEAAAKARAEKEAEDKARAEKEAAVKALAEKEAVKKAEDKARAEKEAAVKALAEKEAVKALAEKEAATKAHVEKEAAAKARVEKEAAVKARAEKEATKAGAEKEAAVKARVEKEAATKAVVEKEAADKVRVEKDAANKVLAKDAAAKGQAKKEAPATAKKKKEDDDIKDADKKRNEKKKAEAIKVDKKDASAKKSQDAEDESSDYASVVGDEEQEEDQNIKSTKRRRGGTIANPKKKAARQQ